MPTLSSASSALSLHSEGKIPKTLRQRGRSGTNEVRTLRMTVVRVTKLKLWKIIPIFLRSFRSALPSNWFTDTSSTSKFPSVMGCILFMARINVDFPAPDLPITATNSPSATCRSIFCSPMVPFGYTLLTCSNTNTSFPHVILYIRR